MITVMGVFSDSVIPDMLGEFSGEGGEGEGVGEGGVLVVSFFRRNAAEALPR